MLNFKANLLFLFTLFLLGVMNSANAASVNSKNKAQAGEEVISAVLAAGVTPAPIAPNSGAERDGPFQRLIIQNAMMIDGTGAPPVGPITIVVENDRIVQLIGGGTGGFHSGNSDADADTRVIDASGKYVLPGFIDSHVHFGTPSHAFVGSLTNPEYVAKLLLAHGITTIRDVGSLMGLGWTLEHKELSDKGQISAPRIRAYALFPETMSTPKQATKWVADIHKRGADGIKFLGAAPEPIRAALKEAKKRKLGTAYHHSQMSVTRTNVLDSARLGLDSMEHWYGLPEAMFEDRRVQNYPYDYNYGNEQDRFANAGRLWSQTTARGSKKWRDTINELVELDFTIAPTFNVYEANRDTMRARNLDWHEAYTMPYMMRAFKPNPKVHGAYHFDWTTADEIAWKNNFSKWMSFVNDFKNAGGRVTVGGDSGFIYSVYGFAYVREMELLQEAGFHPLEVLRSATLNGAELLGLDDQLGSIEVGKKADFVIVNENPIANFKVLYATGHPKLNLQTNTMETTKGIEYTIKDGIVFDVKQLLADVRRLVAQQREREAQ